MTKVQPGIDVLLTSRLALLRGRRVGIVTNHTGTNSALELTLDLLVRHPEVRVTALFAGEHGIRGDVAAGVHIGNSTDPETGLPVWSLYGETRKPTVEMLANVDVLVFDMQDSGSRFYTYTWTMALCMQAAAENQKSMVVLDRPNPITGVQVEGGLVKPGFESFVGLYPVPTRHGLTLGEIALLCNRAYGINCDLQVVPCAGWQRAMWWEDTGLPFVAMSPNSDDMQMIVLYPGTCFFEGTNISEGRGTTQPFQVFGAPWLHEQAVIAELKRRNLPGVLYRPTFFTPWYSKWHGELCRGIQVHVVDRTVLQPVALGAHLLDVCKRVHPDKFAWREADGAYAIRSIDRLSGSDVLRTRLDAGHPVEKVLAAWDEEAQGFTAEAKRYYLYT